MGSFIVVIVPQRFPQVATVGLDTQIERTSRMPRVLDKVEQPGIMTEEEEVTSGEEEHLPDLQEKPSFKPRRSASVSQQEEKTTTIKKKFSILSLVELDPVVTAPASPTSSTRTTSDSKMGSTTGTTFLNMESLLATDLLQRKLSLMSNKLVTTMKSDEQEEVQLSEK